MVDSKLDLTYNIDNVKCVDIHVNFVNLNGVVKWKNCSK